VCVRPDLFGLLRALLVGQGLGLVADGLVLIVFAQSVLFDVGRAASPGRIAAVLMVSLLPYSLVGPFVGVFLDRYDRRRTLVTVSASRALLVVGGAAVTAAGSVPAAYACVLLLFCLSRLALTAKGAALPRSVPSEGLVQATALSGGVGTASAFVGAFVGALGGWRIADRSAAAGCAATGPGRAVLAPALPETGSVRIGVVQPGVTSGAAVREVRQEAATARLAAYHPDLVVWAESSVGSDLTHTPGLLAGLRSLSRTVGADLLVNVDAHQAGQARRAKQSVLIGPGGVRAAYDKIRLVPFGEYIPLRPLLGGLSDVTRAAPEDRRRGRNLTIMRTGTLAVAPLVCFESAFPDMARREVGRGAQLIVYQTSTSTFQGSWAQPQHASLAAVRAAETGRPVVHAGLTGISAVFDSRGRPLAWQSPDYRGAFVVRVPLTSGTTPYLRAGDWVLALSFSTLAAASTAASLERGRRRGLPTAR
jgi:apolipoprotein N-acyltransferase